MCIFHNLVKDQIKELEFKWFKVRPKRFDVNAIIADTSIVNRLKLSLFEIPIKYFII